jgi:CheY-like chemotaxis protein
MVREGWLTMADSGQTDGVQTRTILLMVRESYDRMYTSMLLQRFGYHVYTANTTEEAVEFLSVAKPGLVIADASLANAKGFDLLGTMKQNPRAAAPVILLSPAITPAVKTQYLSAGYTDALKKPINASGLYQAVQQAIEPYPRRNIRVSVNLNANLDGTPAGIDEYAVVLSENGMFVRTTAPRPASTSLHARLMIKGRRIVVDAIVLYSNGFKDYPAKELGMGMRFEKISDEDKAWIRSFVQEEIEKGIQRASVPDKYLKER